MHQQPPFEVSLAHRGKWIKLDVAFLRTGHVGYSWGFYFGDRCFPESHTKYTNNYCWVRNTYYLPFDEDVPKEGDRRVMIPYYQWIPFILLGQALFFYLPSVVWHGLNQKSGVDADNILASANGFNAAEKVRASTRILSTDMQTFELLRNLHNCAVHRRFVTELFLTGGEP